MKSNTKNKSVQTNKTTKSVKSAPKKIGPKETGPKKVGPREIKVAMPPKIKNKISVAGAITAVDEEFNQFLANQTNNQTKQVVFVASPRRKEKFVDPGVLMRLEASRGILRKPNGEDDYSLPTIKQFNKAVAENRLNGSPIAEKE